MAVTHVNDFAATATGTVAVPTTCSIGDLVVVCGNNRNSLPTTPFVTDAASNTYTLVDSNSNNPSFTAIYYTIATAALTAQNVSVTYGSGFGEAVTMVFQGVASASTVVDWNNGFQSLATNLTISTAGTHGSPAVGDLVVGAFGNKTGSVVFTKGASYTLGKDQTNSTSQLSTEWKVATGSGNQTADGTYGAGTTLSEVIAVFKQTATASFVPRANAVYMQAVGRSSVF